MCVYTPGVVVIPYSCNPIPNPILASRSRPSRYGRNTLLRSYYMLTDPLRERPKRVVKASQGIKETFSTGSQNQNPPQPNS